MEAIEGTVTDIIYRSADGYTVLEIDGNVPTVVVGTLPEIKTGEYARFFGDFKEHKTYGMQFFATACESALPADINDIVLFLSGGFIKGLGDVLSSRIVEMFGEDTFRVIEESPALLSSVKGVSKRLAQNIHTAFLEYTGSREAYARLMGMGLSAKQAMAAYTALGAGAADIAGANPYVLIPEVRGIDFITADSIAENMGISADHPLRMESGIIHILRKSLERGYTNVPEDMLLKTAANRLGVAEEKAEYAMNALCLAGRIVRRCYKGVFRVFLRSAYEAEHGASSRLLKLIFTGAANKIADIEEKLERQKKLHSLSDEQVLALSTALENSVCVITGGPGTGKTTILRALTHILAASGETFLLCAPTGRAAKRMQQSCGADAYTIHRLLEYSHGSGDDEEYHFRKNEKNPLECDVLVVDEASMIDIFIFNSLLSALKTGTRLVIVGDANQLPSVGPGAVMEDVISSGVLPVIRLTHIYRHDGGIADAAHAVLAGNMPEFTEDFVFIPEEEPERIKKCAIDLYGEYFDSGLDVQLLTPVKAGEIGASVMDEALRERVNPASASKAELLTGLHLYRVGDRVMQIKNNYDREWYTGDMRGEGIFNGDIGVIVRIAAGSIYVDFEGKVSGYDTEELSELSGAYAYTIHKSQGNEFDVVILPMKYPENPFFSRNLLYTAVTRAKKKAVVIGSKRTLEYMISNFQRDKRFTSLEKELEAAADILVTESNERFSFET